LSFIERNSKDLFLSGKGKETVFSENSQFCRLLTKNDYNKDMKLEIKVRKKVEDRPVSLRERKFWTGFTEYLQKLINKWVV